MPQSWQARLNAMCMCTDFTLEFRYIVEKPISSCPFANRHCTGNVSSRSIFYSVGYIGCFWLNFTVLWMVRSDASTYVT